MFLYLVDASLGVMELYSGILFFPSCSLGKRFFIFFTIILLFAGFKSRHLNSSYNFFEPLRVIKMQLIAMGKSRGLTGISIPERGRETELEKYTIMDLTLARQIHMDGGRGSI